MWPDERSQVQQIFIQDGCFPLVVVMTKTQGVRILFGTEDLPAGEDFRIVAKNIKDWQQFNKIQEVVSNVLDDEVSD